MLKLPYGSPGGEKSGRLVDGVKLVTKEASAGSEPQTPQGQNSR